MRQKARGRLVLTRGSADSRLFVHLLATFINRADRVRRGLYGDLEMAAVFDTIGIVSIEAGMRDEEFRAKFSDYRQVVGISGQRSVNALSISQATGIPRETVRRKLKLLLSKGLIAEQSRGRYVVAPGFVQKPENLAVFERAMTDSLQFMNDAIALGLVRWTREPDEA